MIRLATVFSGIGAIEHALNRMDIDTKIVFACDNGDIDVLSKKINVNMDDICIELDALKKLIKDMSFTEDDDYENQLMNMLDVVEQNYDNIKEVINLINVDICENDVKKILNIIVDSLELKNTRYKQYTEFNTLLSSSDLSSEQRKLLLLQIILKITNDFKKDNSLDDLGKSNIKFSSSFNINWNCIDELLKKVYDNMEKNNGKKIIRQVRDLSQRVGQLHGKINSLHHLNELKKIDSFANKKAYVDNIYKGNEKRNKVKLSYMENYDCSEDHFHWDVTFLDGTQYRNQVDLFVGGSPCQSFSLVGKQRGLSDTRGTLFYEYARLIDEIQPKVFIYENVRAVLSNDCGRTWEKMKEVFQQLGYNIYFTNNDKPSILNAKDYGIPQNRERLFVVGFRSDLKLEQDFQFPKPIKLDKTMQDFLMDNIPFFLF